MTKWICDNKECGFASCLTEMRSDIRPQCCPAMSGYFSEWKREEPQKQDEAVTNCNGLPDWCEVGEFFYYAKIDWEEDRRYLKITDIKNGGVYAKENDECDPCWISFNAFKQFAKQARIRPWTAREAIGKVICWKGDYSFQENIAIINAVDYEGFLMGDLIGNLDPQELTRDCFYQPDGKPCGVLEHMNDDGEWKA